MMSKTIENLQTAFAGESQANRKYLVFAEKADKDGFPQIAKLFRAAAHAETIHAINHFKAMGGVSSTAENLKAAIDGENHEVTSMYPPMVAEAENAGEKVAARSLTWALEVEKIHEKLFTQSLENLEAGLEGDDYYVCPVCGYTHEGPFEGRCPVCNTPAERFERIS